LISCDFLLLLDFFQMLELKGKIHWDKLLIFDMLFEMHFDMHFDMLKNNCKDNRRLHDVNSMT